MIKERSDNAHNVLPNRFGIGQTNVKTIIRSVAKNDLDWPRNFPKLLQNLTHINSKCQKRDQQVCKTM